MDKCRPLELAHQVVVHAYSSEFRPGKPSASESLPTLGANRGPRGQRVRGSMGETDGLHRKEVSGEIVAETMVRQFANPGRSSISRLEFSGS